MLSLREISELAKAKVLHYTFDDVEEPTVNLLPNPITLIRDKSDYGNDSLPLTVSNTSAFVEDCMIGRFSSSYSLAKDDYVALPNLGTKDKYSISFGLIKIIQQVCHLVVYMDGHFIGMGQIRIDSIHGGTSDEWYYNSGDTINNWNHYVVTYDGTKVEVFINGVSKGSKALQVQLY